ncbi:MAG: EAL domain-containing protein [Curvibacter sp.]|nr:MAG: EAL domain-containing protein [Curvibacter sp.]
MNANGPVTAPPTTGPPEHPARAEIDAEENLLEKRRRLVLRRLKQFLGMAVAGTLLLLLNDLLLVHSSAAPSLVVTLGVFFTALCLSYQGRARASLILLITGVLATVGVVLWLEQGIRDSAAVMAMTFPVVVSAMAGSRPLFFTTTALAALVLMAVALGDITGLHPHHVRPVRLSALISLEVVMLAVGASIALIARDLRHALHDAYQQAASAREARRQMEALAFLDPLTGLPNRAAMAQHFEREAARASRDQRRLGVFFLDLDNFKTVNDSLGHPAGDALLRQVAEALLSVVRKGDVVSRIGGDEFMVLVPDLQSDLDVPALADKLVKRLTQPFHVDGASVTATCSLGIALYPDDGHDFAELVKRADTAMYHAKNAGRNALRLFNEDMNSNVVEHLHLLNGMRQALEHGRFELHYQPQINIRNGDIVGCEALLRWREPGLGLIPPSRFIPAAEKSGLIVEIGTWVLQEACRQIKRWDDAGLPGITVAVNLSSVQFKRGDIEQVILNALDSARLTANRLELELTESLLIEDSERFSGLLKRLNELGLTFSIDDFGTGYSNLGYLNRFDVDRLKIDRSFVHDICTDTHHQTIVRAVVQIAGSLGMAVIAEGVEDQATADKLLELGCELGQGWLWSPALAADDYAAYVRQQGRAAPA